MNKNKKLKVSIVMGSQSDYKIMKLSEKTLRSLGASLENFIQHIKFESYLKRSQ